MTSKSDHHSRFHVVNKNQASSISEVQVQPCQSSQYLKPLRMKYKQNGSSKSWDYLKIHNSVAILLFNTDREVFILVRQFRPAVYAEVTNAYTEGQTVDTDQCPGSVGLSYELCAGIVDKNIGLKETAYEEILEETGYDVPLERIKEMMKIRSSVGVAGSRQTVFYAEVTDSMRKSLGGGNPHEGESIEVLEIPIKDANDFIFDDMIEKPGGLIAAFLWYFREKGMTFR